MTNYDNRPPQLTTMELKLTTTDQKDSEDDEKIARTAKTNVNVVFPTVITVVFSTRLSSLIAYPIVVAVIFSAHLSSPSSVRLLSLSLTICLFRHLLRLSSLLLTSPSVRRLLRSSSPSSRLPRRLRRFFSGPLWSVLGPLW